MGTFTQQWAKLYKDGEKNSERYTVTELQRDLKILLRDLHFLGSKMENQVRYYQPKNKTSPHNQKQE